MRRNIILGAIAIIIIVVGYFVYNILTTPPASPKDVAEYTSGDLSVKVVYSRPFKKGRLIFGKESDGALVPYDQYWRLGANEATEITFGQPTVFVGNIVPAGSYRMYAVPGEYTWEVSLNSELGKFGYFEPDYDLDIVKVKLPVKSNSSEVEQFTIQFKEDSTNVNIQLLWDKTLVEIPVAAQR